MFALKSIPTMLAPSLTKEETQAPLVLADLILARIPVELVEQRNNHFNTVAQNQMDAVDRDWMRENNALMPKQAPQRKTSVSFGSRGK